MPVSLTGHVIAVLEKVANEGQMLGYTIVISIINDVLLVFISYMYVHVH